MAGSGQNTSRGTESVKEKISKRLPGEKRDATQKYKDHHRVTRGSWGGGGGIRETQVKHIDGLTKDVKT